jgi:hydrogenase maturation protease
VTAVVVGLGQPAAGDDGVGLVVAQTLVGRGLEVRESTDATVLLALLEARRRVVLVDAVIAGPPGAVLQLDAGALASGRAPLSSHGLGVVEALALARTLYGTDLAADVAIVGISISPPAGPRAGLSPAVAAAVEPAAALAAALAR